MDSNAENIIQAKAIWALFEEKISRRIVLDDTKTTVHIKKHQDNKELTINENMAHRKLVSFFKKTLSQDTLVYIRKEGSGDFNDILPAKTTIGSHYEIKRSLNLKKQESLLSAINNSNWKDSIFSDKTLPYIAISLFEKGKISRQQIYTILEFYETIQEYSLSGEFFLPLLTDTDPPVLTHFAEKFIMQEWFGFDPSKKKTLEMLIATLPKSEQTYYITMLSRYNKPNDTFDDTLLKLHVLIKNPDLRDSQIHLSAGAQEALGIATFGDNFVPNILKTGIHKINQIEHGMHNDIRYTAISFPDIKPYPDVHGHIDASKLAIRKHDQHHSNVMSSIPPVFRNILKHFIKVIRDTSQYVNSKEIWNFTDMEFTLFLDYPELAKKTVEKEHVSDIFGLFLCYGAGDALNVGSYLIYPNMRKELRRYNTMSTYQDSNNWRLMNAGAMIIRDMIENEAWYRSLGINIREVHPFSSFITKLEPYYHMIKESHPIIQTTKIMLLFNLYNKYNDNLTAQMFNLLSRKIDMMGDKITFKKASRSSSSINNTLLINSSSSFDLSAFRKLISPNEQNLYIKYFVAASNLQEIENKIKQEIDLDNPIHIQYYNKSRIENKSHSERVEILNHSLDQLKIDRDLIQQQIQDISLLIEKQAPALREAKIKADIFSARINHFFMQNFTQKTSVSEYITLFKCKQAQDIKKIELTNSLLQVQDAITKINDHLVLEKYLDKYITCKNELDSVEKLLTPESLNSQNTPDEDILSSNSTHHPSR